MAGIGPNGRFTSHPNCGEKHCVACEHWTGARELSYNGTAATSLSSQGAMCTVKRAVVTPNLGCSCSTMKFEKWRLIK
jgi:hypothetical protein